MPQRPNPPISSISIKDLFDELRKESDRAAAIIGGAFIDERLAEYIAFFLVDDAKAVSALLGNGKRRSEAPASSFAARIALAYCLGLLTTEQRDDLNRIRAIRNAFAHRLLSIDFTQSMIADQCRQLRAPRYTLSPEAYPTASPRRYFEETIIAMYVDFASAKMGLVGRRRVVPPTSDDMRRQDLMR